MAGRNNVQIKAAVERFPITFIAARFSYYYKYQLLVSLKKKYENKKPNTTLKEDLSISEVYESMIGSTDLVISLKLPLSIV